MELTAYEEMIAQLVEEYGDVKNIYGSLYSKLVDIRVHSKDLSQEERVNILYIIKEISKYCNDLRKECDGIVDLIEKLVCAIHTHRGITEPIRASLATGSPKVTLSVKIPNRKRDPEKYKLLMNYLGVPDEAACEGTVRPHWPSICAKLTEMAENGEPSPPGIDPDGTYPKFGVNIIMYKNLDELLELMNERRLSDEQVNALTKRQ